jgi:hypothetical protein
MGPQSCGSLKFENFGTPIWKSWDKKPFGCGPVERCRIYYKGEGGGFPPSPGRGEFCESKLPMARLSTKSAPIMH